MVLAYKTCRLVEAVGLDGSDFSTLKFTYASEIAEPIVRAVDHLVLIGSSKSGAFAQGRELLRRIVAHRADVRLYRCVSADVIGAARILLRQDGRFADYWKDPITTYCQDYLALPFQREGATGSYDRRLTVVAAHLAATGEMLAVPISGVL